ncbi:hypothetical protein [Pseudomonas sp. NPDC007930]|uniref:hypothetical protein n=1 Tax=Pseudomonas sp. NPDC007930 TaxID=3364417 RepID=UPI0036E158FB
MAFFRRLAVVFLALAAASLAQGGSAPWYSYRSMVSNQLVCSQVDPGPQFVRFAGPFRNAGCRP